MSQAVVGLSPTQIALAAGTRDFRLGTVGGYDHPTEGYKEYVYCKAGAAITALGYVCVETTGNVMNMITTALSAPGVSGYGSRVGVAQAAMAVGDFGWFQVFGKGSLRTATAAAIGTRLNTTATAGAIDDDGTAGARAIHGVTLQTLTAGAATGPDGMIVYPTVGETL